MKPARLISVLILLRWWGWDLQRYARRYDVGGIVMGEIIVVDVKIRMTRPVLPEAGGRRMSYCDE